MTKTNRTEKTVRSAEAVETTVSAMFEPMTKTMKVATDSMLESAAATSSFAIASMRAGLSLQEEALRVAFTAVSGAEKVNAAAGDAARELSASVANGAAFEFPFKSEFEQWNALAVEGFRKNMELFAFPMNQFVK
jgi:hypothetical protein